jgi:hypothetical protein
MSPPDLDLNLSEIHTHWSKLLTPDHEILRYYGAVFRYLLGMIGQPAVAQELANDFAARFLAGKFTSADPGRGRLRDLIKVAVRNLAIDYWRAQQKAKRVIELDESKLADQLLGGQDDPTAFDAACRDDCLSATWKGLEQAEQADGKPFFTVLKFKVDHPDLPSDELAKHVGGLLNKPLSADAMRQTLHRARTLFADLLLDVVGRSLGSTDVDLLEEELIELQLLGYCKSALNRRKKNRKSQ